MGCLCCYLTECCNGMLLYLLAVCGVIEEKGYVALI